MPITSQMTTQTGHSDYARHARDQRRQRSSSPSHKTSTSRGGNRK